MGVVRWECCGAKSQQRWQWQQTTEWRYNRVFGDPAWCSVVVLGPVSLIFFAHNSNSMETSPCHNSVAGHQIATFFCTCHDSTAVVPCTKFCNDHCIRIEVRVKRNFHRIWMRWKNLVKRAPGPYRHDTDFLPLSPNWARGVLSSPAGRAGGRASVTSHRYRSPGRSSYRIAVKLGGDESWGRISDEFVHGRRGSLIKRWTS